MNLEGNTYYHKYHDAEFQIIAVQDDEYVCAWLSGEAEGFRYPVGDAPSDEWELVEEV